MAGLTLGMMRILDEGYFASGARKSGKSVGFRLEGYEPVDVHPSGPALSVEDVGIVRLAKLAVAHAARLRGKIELEQTDASAAFVNSWIRSIRSTPPPVPTRETGERSRRAAVKQNGVFRFEGLTPVQAWPLRSNRRGCTAQQLHRPLRLCSQKSQGIPMLRANPPPGHSRSWAGTTARRRRANPFVRPPRRKDHGPLLGPDSRPTFGQESHDMTSQTQQVWT